MPHITKHTKLTLIFTLTILLALALAGSASAEPPSAEEHCEDTYMGIWTGSTPSEVGAWCVDTQGFLADAVCGTGWYLDWQYLGGISWQTVIPENCHQFPTKFGTVSPFSAQGGKCKLTDIDNPIRRGAPGVFEASWVGTLESIKFFSNAEGNNGGSAAPIAGSVSKSGNVSTGLFAGPSVDAGRYFALCFGPGGSGGGSIGGIQVTE